MVQSPQASSAMHIIPVIDLLDGLAVHARRGLRSGYRPVASSLCPDPDPQAVLRAYLSLYPFRTVYVADLNAIQNTGDNDAVMRGLLAAFPGMEFWLDAGKATLKRTVPALRPVLGTERPPVARTTASASSGPAPSRSMRQARAVGLRPVTLVSGRKRAPRRVARARSPSRTSLARWDAGKSFPESSSSTSGRPSSRSKNSTCSESGHERSMLRSVCGEESVTKRVSSTRAGRMLQRPPPLMRILRPPSRVRSSSSVSAPAEAAKIAAIEPAAPAPMTTMRRDCTGGARYPLTTPTGRRRATFRASPARWTTSTTRSTSL